jgi:hypothetical protein
MAQASLLVIMPCCQLVAIAEIECKSAIFKRFKASIKVCNPYNAITLFDEV